MQPMNDRTEITRLGGAWNTAYLECADFWQGPKKMWLEAVPNNPVLKLEFTDF
jgi:hypothetical protein